MPSRVSFFSGTWKVRDNKDLPNDISYRFWIQTSIEEADEGAKIGELKARNNPIVSGGDFDALPCRDLILDNKYMDGIKSKIDIHYVDDGGVQQDLTLVYLPNASNNKVKLVSTVNKGLTVLSGTDATSCSAT